MICPRCHLLQYVSKSHKTLPLKFTDLDLNQTRWQDDELEKNVYIWSPQSSWIRGRWVKLEKMICFSSVAEELNISSSLTLVKHLRTVSSCQCHGVIIFKTKANVTDHKLLSCTETHQFYISVIIVIRLQIQCSVCAEGLCWLKALRGTVIVENMSHYFAFSQGIL